MIELKTAPTFVLVHGAWADGTSWHKVIDALEAAGARAVAAPIPLTSVSDDVRALDRCLTRIEGPVVLAAHAYAGAVISGSKNERVKGLVFVAALAPDEGETVGEVFGRGKPHPEAPQLAPDGDGFIWMPESAFAAAFAQNASLEESALFAAVQRPINGACLQEKCWKPLWQTLPAWNLLAVASIRQCRWDDARHYHLVLDSTAIPLDACVEMITLAARRASSTTALEPAAG